MMISFSSSGSSGLPGVASLRRAARPWRKPIYGCTAVSCRSRAIFSRSREAACDARRSSRSMFSMTGNACAPIWLRKRASVLLMLVAETIKMWPLPLRKGSGALMKACASSSSARRAAAASSCHSQRPLWGSSMRAPPVHGSQALTGWLYSAILSCAKASRGLAASSLRSELVCTMPVAVCSTLRSDQTRVPLSCMTSRQLRPLK